MPSRRRGTGRRQGRGRAPTHAPGRPTTSPHAAFGRSPRSRACRIRRQRPHRSGGSVRRPQPSGLAAPGDPPGGAAPLRELVALSFEDRTMLVDLGPTGSVTEKVHRRILLALLHNRSGPTYRPAIRCSMTMLNEDARIVPSAALIHAEQQIRPLHEPAPRPGSFQKDDPHPLRARDRRHRPDA